MQPKPGSKFLKEKLKCIENFEIKWSEWQHEAKKLEEQPNER